MEPFIVKVIFLIMEHNIKEDASIIPKEEMDIKDVSTPRIKSELRRSYMAQRESDSLLNPDS